MVVMMSKVGSLKIHKTPRGNDKGLPESHELCTCGLTESVSMTVHSSGLTILRMNNRILNAQMLPPCTGTTTSQDNFPSTERLSLSGRVSAGGTSITLTVPLIITYQRAYVSSRPATRIERREYLCRQLGTFGHAEDCMGWAWAPFA